MPKKWYFEIGVSMGRSLKKAKGVKEKKEEDEYKLFLAFWRKAKIRFYFCELQRLIYRKLFSLCIQVLG